MIPIRATETHYKNTAEWEDTHKFLPIIIHLPLCSHTGIHSHSHMEILCICLLLEDSLILKDTIAILLILKIIKTTDKASLAIMKVGKILKMHMGMINFNREVPSLKFFDVRVKKTYHL